MQTNDAWKSAPRIIAVSPRTIQRWFLAAKLFSRHPAIFGEEVGSSGLNSRERI